MSFFISYFITTVMLNYHRVYFIEIFHNEKIYNKK